MITIVKMSRSFYKVHWINGVYIGDFIKDVDGYFVFYPNPRNYGYYNEYFLRALADKLEELNKEWDEHIKNDPNIN